jgi:hypothetical protein
MPLLRYAILHHTTTDGAHYDVMIESSPVGPLLTWRIAEWPVVEPTPAMRLPDHRRAYLTYEGAISGDRGTVRRVEGGEAVVELNGPDEIVFRRGEEPLLLQRVRSSDWMIAPLG